MALEGGSFGFQIGGQSTDFVLLVMNKRGAQSILSSKVKLGGDMSAAAGPVGRNASAETDIAMNAEILTYSRARGLFAEISLSGSTVRPDDDGNARLYGKGVSGEDIIINSTIRPPASAKALLSTQQEVSEQQVRSSVETGAVLAGRITIKGCPRSPVPRWNGQRLALCTRARPSVAQSAFGTQPWSLQHF